MPELQVGASRRAASDTGPVPRLSGGVAVGGGEKHQHLLAFADGVSADLNRTGGGTKEGLHGALKADYGLFKVQ